MSKVLLDPKTTLGWQEEKESLHLRLEPNRKMNFTKFLNELNYLVQRRTGTNGPHLQLDNASPEIKHHIRLLIGLIGARNNEQIAEAAKELEQMGWEQTVLRALTGISMLKFYGSRGMLTFP